MRELRAQPLRPNYYQDMESQVLAAIRALVFDPLLAVLRPATPQAPELRNDAEDALRSALRSGRVQYAAGEFSGEFNVEISRALRRMGAAKNPRTGAYRLDQSAVPGWVKAEASAYAQTARAAHSAARAKLDEIQGQLDSLVAGRKVRAGKTVRAVAQGWREASRGLEVMPELTEAGLEQLAAAYSENMALSIRGFAQDMIRDLRESVETNAEQGYRFDRLAARIEQRYGVASGKAAFLARQETSLFMAQFRRQRFADAGVQRYRWSTSHDVRVRHDHRELNGKTFFYAQPPVVDKTSGRRANPGEDYNCRCVDIPILDPVVAVAA